jgi:hypothetical protein
MRFPVELLDEWDARAGETHDGNRTDWLVDHLDWFFRTGLRTAQPKKKPGTEPEPEPTAEIPAPVVECSHPRDAEVKLQYMTRCGVCGKRIR